LAKGHRGSISPSPVEVTEVLDPRIHLLQLASSPGRGQNPATETPTSPAARLNALRHVNLRGGGRIGPPHRKRHDNADEDQGDPDSTGDVMLDELVFLAAKREE